MHAFLNELGLPSWLKTSGGKGLHVVVPLTPQARLGHRQGLLASDRAAPGARRSRSASSPRAAASNRVGKIFIDYLRNGFAPRPRGLLGARAAGAGRVDAGRAGRSCPSSGRRAMDDRHAREHLSFQKIDPWAEYWNSRQTLTGAMKALAAVS